MAARLAAADAGAARAPAGRAWRSTGCTAPSGRRCPGWPHEDPTDRVLHRPSTTATLHLAAAAAHGRAALPAGRPAYARPAPGAAARSAYDAPACTRTLLAAGRPRPPRRRPVRRRRRERRPATGRPAELWLATGEPRLRAEVLASPDAPRGRVRLGGLRLRPRRRTGAARPGAARRPARRTTTGWSSSLRDGADRLLDLQAQQPWGQPYAPTDGWDWGSNGRILNNLVVLGVAQLVTGDGALPGRRRDRDRTTCSAATRSARATSPATAPTTPATSAPGSSATTSTRRCHRPAGRPGRRRELRSRTRTSRTTPASSGCRRSCCYLDEPTSEVTNDVCIRWNAPLVWVTAFLAAEQSLHPRADQPGRTLGRQAREDVHDGRVLPDGDPVGVPLDRVEDAARGGRRRRHQLLQPPRRRAGDLRRRTPEFSTIPVRVAPGKTTVTDTDVSASSACSPSVSRRTAAFDAP